MIDLYFAPTGNGRRAAIALEECGLPYQLHRVELGKPKPEGLLKINPLGAIPAVVDSEGPGGQPFALTQSAAILLYAAEKSGRFLPTDLGKRARVFEWLMAAVTDIGPTSSAIFYITTHGSQHVQSATEVFEKRLLTFFQNVDARLKEVEYLAGELSIADLALISNWMGRQAMLLKHGPLPNVQRWGETVAARAGVQKAMKL
jgi:GSH-dependent disulfide-bond oxidoreductase